MSEEAATGFGDQRALIDAQFKITILTAQLGGWEAACAAQVTAAQLYLDALAGVSHDGPQIAARSRLANAIDSNVGQLLLQKLAALEIERDRARHSYAQCDAKLAMALERSGFLERQAELLRDAARPAATLLFTLDQRGGLGPDVHRAISETLAPLDSVLAASGKEHQ